jgi:hypothetical protein
MKKNKLKIIEVFTLNEFKIELEKYINNFSFNEFNIEIGIPKFSIYTPILIKGTYKNFKFNGELTEGCKWHDYNFYYDDIFKFYNDFKVINYDILDEGFISELIEHSNFDFDTPMEDLSITKIIWEEGTPFEIKKNFEDEEIDKYCNEYKVCDTIIPKIEYFKIILINNKIKDNFELSWISNDNLLDTTIEDNINKEEIKKTRKSRRKT